MQFHPEQRTAVGMDCNMFSRCPQTFLILLLQHNPPSNRVLSWFQATNFNSSVRQIETQLVSLAMFRNRQIFWEIHQSQMRQSISISCLCTNSNQLSLAQLGIKTWTNGQLGSLQRSKIHLSAPLGYFKHQQKCKSL